MRGVNECHVTLFIMICASPHKLLFEHDDVSSSEFQPPSAIYPIHVLIPTVFSRCKLRFYNRDNLIKREAMYV